MSNSAGWPATVVVMGVAGTGKTTIGRLLAERLGADFVEGDDYHPPANVEKMRSGRPLDDADRRPWLEALATAIAGWRRDGCCVVLACSALKRAYRQTLREAVPELRFVHLVGSEALIAERLAARAGHYMPATLLASQLAALEPPNPAEQAVNVTIEAEPEAIVREIVERLVQSERIRP
ncbi:MAG: gluconokinase [Alphaproteobacteria bacterium]|jgi:carbohydrate kinase (thermoresistant glucokinase family)|nr:gluconokinase [Alphaproteobacteria bacterium]